jgi:transposase
VEAAAPAVLTVESLLGRIAELEALVARLEALVEQQQATLAVQAAEIEGLRTGKGTGRSVKTPQNSSVPPSSVPPANRPKRSPGRQRGGRPGHRGVSRCRAQPDLVVECRPAACSRCGGDLSDRPQWVRGRSQQVELPPVEPFVIEVVRYGCTCPGCGARQAAGYPEGWDPQQTFGPRLQATLAYLHHHDHLSFERLRQGLGQLFGVRMSEGAIAASLKRTAAGLQATYQAIREQVQGSAVVGSDETRQRVDGQSGWSWVVQSAVAAYHWVGASRATQELRDFYGDNATQHPEVQESDCFSAQLASPVLLKQVCQAHQLRDLKAAEEQGDTAYAPKMARLIRMAIHLWGKRQALPPERYQHQGARLQRLAHRLAWGPLTPSPFGEPFQQRYRRLEASWWVFLDREDVAPTNNASERALRPVVVHRKVTGGFRSAWGAEAYAVFVSVAQTAQKQGRAILPALLDVLMPHDPLTLGLSPSG